jgi:hypothetical protein
MSHKEPSLTVGLMPRCAQGVATHNYRTPTLSLPSPAVNCWATIIRPHCGLINPLFGQSLSCIFGVTIGGSRLESYYGKLDYGGATTKAIGDPGSARSQML